MVQLNSRIGQLERELQQIKVCSINFFIDLKSNLSNIDNERSYCRNLFM